MRSSVGVWRPDECSGILRLFTAGNVLFCNYLTSVQMRSSVGVRRLDKCSRLRDGIFWLFTAGNVLFCNY